MAERKPILDLFPDRDHVIEVVVRAAQRDYNNPALSETFKNASEEVTLETLAEIPPKQEDV